MKKVLITGINGFVGSHLAEHCLSKNAKVFGLVRHRSNLKNINHLRGKIDLHEGDVEDIASMHTAMDAIKPNIVFHLAAQSYVPYSWTTAAKTMSTNVIGTVNVLDVIRRVVPQASVLVIGSSEEYGLVKDGEWPIKEDNPLRPLSPYGVSKVAEDMLGVQYHRSYGLNIIVSRAFNHSGPRRGKEFVIPSFIKRVLIAKKRRSEISVGNLDAIRDFTDVRDIVKAYWLLATKGKAGEVYNICSGKGYPMSNVLYRIINYIDSSLNDKVVTDKKYLRPSDVPVLIGSHEKITSELGWYPEIPFNTTIKDMIEWMRGM